MFRFKPLIYLFSSIIVVFFNFVEFIQLHRSYHYCKNSLLFLINSTFSNYQAIKNRDKPGFYKIFVLLYSLEQVAVGKTSHCKQHWNR
jgi:uncharacterized membrane protein (DUF106 family)